MTPAPVYTHYVKWADLDANGHMKNTAFFDYSAQCRFDYFSSQGFTSKDFAEHKIGPAALSETIKYKRELRHGQEFTVSLAIAAANATNTRFEFENTIRLSSDQTVCATLRTMFVWLDLEKRKATPPPEKLLAALLTLPRTADYQDF